jgi:hypothetical protein
LLWARLTSSACASRVKRGDPDIHKRKEYITGPHELGHRSSERREACRYDTVNAPAFLGWWEGTEYRSVSATLKNLSLHGALALVDQLPAADTPLWTCLEGSPASAWVETEVIATTKPRRGPYQLRLKFVDPVPFDSFCRAIQQYNAQS